MPMLPLLNTTPMFRVTANALTKQFTITDLIQSAYANYGAGVLTDYAIIFRVSVDGTIIYANAGYATDDFSSPDLEGLNPTWVSSAIDFPLDSVTDLIQAGDYLFEYKVTDGVTVVTTTNTKTWNYVAPEVVIDLSASCRTSELTSVDNTEYDITLNSVIYTPVTQTRTHTITKPAGCGANAPGSTTDKTRVIGGGSTDATRLWTRVWQTNITTVLQYNLEYWDGTSGTPWWFIVTDTVYGDDFIDVECDTTMCCLLNCYHNLAAAWRDSTKTNFGFRNDMRDLIIAAGTLIDDINSAERCGLETQDLVDELKTLLGAYDCCCTQAADAKSHVVTEWGSGIGGGSGTPSTFRYSFHSTDPPTGGNDGDVSQNNGGGAGDGNIWQNVGGTWVLMDNVNGATGAQGAAGNNSSGANILYAGLTDGATIGNTSETQLDAYNVPANTLVTVGDELELRSVVDLALNDNGKTVKLYFGGDVIGTYFTDALINATNNSLIVCAKVRKVSVTDQKIESWFETKGGVLSNPTVTLNTKDLSAIQVVKVTGTNSTASAGDITSRSFTVYLHSVMNAIPTGQGYSDKGTVSLVGGVTTFIPFNITMPSTNYVITATAWDVDGDMQLVQIKQALKTVSGFYCMTIVNTTMNWTVQMI